MFAKGIRYLKALRTMQQLNMALARAAAVAGKEKDPTRPETWEFSSFSQNGEDGIIDYLMDRIVDPNYYFIEIGSSSGIENNTTWLAIARKYSGLMIEGDEKASAECRLLMSQRNLGVEVLSMFVNESNIADLLQISLHKNPDFFSLDIDGNDYYLLKLLIENGLLPKVICVEYNSAYGPDNSITIEYDDNFVFQSAHESQLYYGVGIEGWKTFLAQHDYHFVTTDRNGVNAFFAQKNSFEEGFFEEINGVEFRENFYQMRKFKADWRKQFELIAEMPFYEIE